MFEKKSEIWRGESVTVLSGVGDIDLRDTFECGQAFRYERTAEDAGYVEYMTVVGDTVIRVGQRERGELIFSWGSDKVQLSVVQSVEWRMGDIACCLTQLDGALSAEELVAMAEEAINAK